jgi:hypothetical protein
MKARTGWVFFGVCFLWVTLCYGLTLSDVNSKEVKQLLDELGDHEFTFFVLHHPSTFRSLEDLKNTIEKRKARKQSPIQTIVVSGSDSPGLVTRGKCAEGQGTIEIGKLLQEEVKLKGKTFHFLSFPDSDMSGRYFELGAPMIPVLRTLIKAPKGVKPAISVFLEGVQKEFPNLNLYPAQKKTGKDSGMILPKKAEIFDRDAFWPTKDFLLEESFHDKEHTYFSLTIFPLKYNPVSRICRVSRKVRIQSTLPPMKKVSRSTPNAVPYKKLETLYLTVAKYQAPTERLALWRSKNGVPSKVIVLPNEISTTFLFNLASNLSSSPQLANYKPKHIVFVGDDDVLPPQMTTFVTHLESEPDVPESNAFNMATEVGSDLLYFVDKNTYPEKMVSRISVSTLSEMDAFVEKLISYESGTAAGHDFYKNCFLLHNNLPGSTSSHHFNSITEAKKILTDDGFSPIMYGSPLFWVSLVSETYWDFLEKTSHFFEKKKDENNRDYFVQKNAGVGHTRFYPLGIFSSSMYFLEKDFNRGNNFIFCRAHGTPTDVVFGLDAAEPGGKSQRFGNDTMDVFMNNRDQYSIFLSSTCFTGTFRTIVMNGVTIKECMGEKFIRMKQKGGVAFIGSDNASLTKVNSFFMPQYARQICSKADLTLGELVKNAKLKVGNKYGFSPYSPFHLFLHQFNILGDSSMMIRYDAPIAIDLEMKWEKENTLLAQVIPTDGSDCSNVTVCLSDEELPIRMDLNDLSEPQLAADRDTCYHVQKTDAKGHARFSNVPRNRKLFVHAISNRHRRVEKILEQVRK